MRPLATIREFRILSFYLLTCFLSQKFSFLEFLRLARPPPRAKNLNVGAWVFIRLCGHLANFYFLRFPSEKAQKQGFKNPCYGHAMKHQLEFFKFNPPTQLFKIEKGKRKTARPLSTRLSMHLILKSRKYDLKKNERKILKTWNRLAKKWGVKCYGLAVEKDHLHSSIRIHSRKNYARFIQGLTGALNLSLGIRWLNRPVTRLVAWGKDFRRLKQYIQLNFIEAAGFLDYEPRRTRALPEWLKLGP